MLWIIQECNLEIILSICLRMTIYSIAQGLGGNWQPSWAHTIKFKCPLMPQHRAQCLYILLTPNKESKHHSKVFPSPGLPKRATTLMTSTHCTHTDSLSPLKQASYLNPVTNQVIISQLLRTSVAFPVLMEMLVGQCGPKHVVGWGPTHNPSL